MSDDTPNNESETLTIDLGKAIRFSFVCILLGCSCYSIQSSLGISKYYSIFKGMLGENEHLPLLTMFVLNAQNLFITMSFAIPVIGISLLFTKNITRSFYYLGTLALIITVQCIVLHYSLNSPLMRIIEKLQGGP